MFYENTEAAEAWKQLDFTSALDYLTGNGDSDDLDAIIQALNASGYTDMVKECGRQYAAFLEKD